MVSEVFCRIEEGLPKERGENRGKQYSPLQVLF